MSSRTDDRRDRVRTRVHYRMDVTDKSKKFFGCLLDLSECGMRVLCSEEVDVLNVDKLRIELPQWLELGSEIRLYGRFVWCKAKSRQRVEAGFAFEKLSERDRHLLEQVVERLVQAAAEDGVRAVPA